MGDSDRRIGEGEFEDDAIAAVVSWTAMGDTLNTGYTSVSDVMTNAVSGPGSEQAVVETTTVLADKSDGPALR